MKTGSLSLFKSGELKLRAEAAHALLENCTLCPRTCGVNRLAGEHGVCATGRYAKVASYSPHFGEEQPLVGTNGSGTIFFASCNLHCCFCQNYEISHFPAHFEEVTAAQLAAIMLDLQNRHCHNINFVTPSHVVPQILEALYIACDQGLNVPIIYNSSGYDSAEALNLLDGVIDIYMPDFKFWHAESSKNYCDADDYPEVARESIGEMFRQVGDLQINDEGVATRGLLIRHLLMPGGLEETKSIVKFIAESISPRTYLNIMDQYRPCGVCADYPELKQSITTNQYQEAIDFAKQVGLQRLDQRDFGILLRNLGFI